MGIYQGKEEMVVGSTHFCTPFAGYFDRFWWRISHCTIYLYIVLMKREKVLETILVLVLALGIAYWFVRDSSPRLGAYLMLAAGILAFIGLFIPALARGIHEGWMKLAELIGFVMSKVLLTLVFTIFVIPLAFLSRIFGRKATVKLKKEGKTYFTDRSYTYTAESMENVW